MKISKKLAIQILKYLDKYKDFYFPFMVMCEEYGKAAELVEIEPGDWRIIRSGRKYKTFKLRENLQDLNKGTTELLAKGFLEKITNESVEKQIATLARNYRKEWKEELWESEDIEEFGSNEFVGGKAEAYEECLGIIKTHNK